MTWRQQDCIPTIWVEPQPQTILNVDSAILMEQVPSVQLPHHFKLVKGFLPEVSRRYECPALWMDSALLQERHDRVSLAQIWNEPISFFGCKAILFAAFSHSICFLGASPPLPCLVPIVFWHYTERQHSSSSAFLCVTWHTTASFFSRWRIYHNVGFFRQDGWSFEWFDIS